MLDQEQSKNRTIIFAFIIQTGSGFRNQGQAIKASPEKWSKFFRERTGLSEADVVLFEPDSWKSPRVKSLDEIVKNMPTIQKEAQNALKSCGVPSTALERLLGDVQGAPNPMTGQFLFWIVYKGELTPSKEESKPNWIRRILGGSNQDRDVSPTLIEANKAQMPNPVMTEVHRAAVKSLLEACPEVTRWMRDDLSPPMKRIKEIGENLNAQGGKTLMREVHAEFVKSGGAQWSRHLEMMWDGIGDWRG